MSVALREAEQKAYAEDRQQQGMGSEEMIHADHAEPTDEGPGGDLEVKGIRQQVAEMDRLPAEIGPADYEQDKQAGVEADKSA